MDDPWTLATLWELTVGAGGGMSRGGQRGKNQGKYNKITIKMIKIVQVRIKKKEVIAWAKKEINSLKEKQEVKGHNMLKELSIILLLYKVCWI